MSQVSLPVTRPTGRALLVSNAAARAELRETLGRLGYGCFEADEPYAAMAELCRRPLVYRAVILSLAGLYREELGIICAIKGRYPNVEIWLAHTDGRQAALAESMRLGADGLLDEDGLHRVAMHVPDALEVRPPTVQAQQPSVPTTSFEEELAHSDIPRSENLSDPVPEPVLSTDELRALLQEQPVVPPASEQE